MFKEIESTVPKETPEEMQMRMSKEILELERIRKELDKILFQGSMSTDERIKHPRSQEYHQIWQKILQYRNEWKIYFPNKPFPVDDIESLE